EEQRHLGPKPYLLAEFEDLGFNYRMTDLQGAVGLVQIEKLDNFVSERARWARWYAAQLEGLDWLRVPHEANDIRHAWQAFVTYVDPKKAPNTRNTIME